MAPETAQLTEEQLRRLQARAIALGRSLDDLRDRRDAGRIDDGRYADLRTDLDRERIQILLEVQATLKGTDEDLEDVVRDAINGERDVVVMDRLAKVAEKKGLGSKIIDALNEHRGFIVSWIVEIGFEIAKRSAHP